MGKNDEIGQLKRVKCTYKDCQKRFDTGKEMKRHKTNEPEHNYCKKCNVDCEDWEDLTQHKVAAMVPWLEGEMRHNTEESPMHIVCEFCGQDFRSFGGRKIHREQAHPADQSIKCPGCETVFTRPGSYVAHLEQGQCEKISRRTFQINVQTKHVIPKIMKNPEAFNQHIQGNRSDNPGLVDEGSETQGAEDGGVALLGQEDEDQKYGYKPLMAETDLIEMNEPVQRSQHETWPRLPGQTRSDLVDSLRSLAVSSPLQSARTTDVSASEFASQITSRRDSNVVYTESYPSLSLKSQSRQASVQDDDDTASEATTTAASYKYCPAAWGTGQTSNALFRDAKPTPPAGDWGGILKHREQEALADESTNIFKNRMWDPTSKAYDSKAFYNPLVKQYFCPFEGCNEGYDIARDLEGHLHHAHLKTSYRCPLCLKLFKSANALISHATSPGGKCKVEKSTMYPRLLDSVSGGYLKAKYLSQPKVYTPGTAVTKTGQPLNGVMSARYTGKMPGEY